MRYTKGIFMLLVLVMASARAQSLLPTPLPKAAPELPKVEMPKALTLPQAQEILLQNNLTITAARYGLEAMQAQKLIASFKPNPIISFGAEQFDFGHPFRKLIATDSNSAANRVYTYRYEQIIERGAKRQLRTQVAELQAQSAAAQLADATRQQLFQLKQSFYTAVLARENLKVADENLYLTKNLEQLIKLHIEAGDTAAGDLIKFQVNTVQYQRDYLAAQLAYQQATRDVVNLLGAQPAPQPIAIQFPTNAALGTTSGSTDQTLNVAVNIVGELKAEPLTLTLAELQQEAMANRPDVMAAQRNLEAAQRACDLAQALRHRDLDIAGEYQRNGGENTFGVVVSVPLFLHNHHQGEINQALAQLQQAKTQLAQVQLQMMTDVDKAYRAYEMSQKMLQIYTLETLSKAEEAFRIAGYSYKEGATSLLELRDAQRTYNQTRVAYNQAHFDYRMSLFQLELAIGKTLVP
ncbi:MAG: TolC family protein [Acidobacteria bacterium]|nr:TolC family protein [Acidobacteriota bacterium]